MANIDDTLEERGARYGDFSDHAVISQDILDAYQKAPKWAKLSPDKKQALRMFADKVARILNCDPEYKDNWHDIAGYAKLAEDRCVESASMGRHELNKRTLDKHMVVRRKCCQTKSNERHTFDCQDGKNLRSCCPSITGEGHHPKCESTPEKSQYEKCPECGEIFQKSHVCSRNK